MSTLTIRTPSMPKVRLPLRVFARLGALILAVIDVFGEALRQAHEAQRRYPFTAW